MNELKKDILIALLFITGIASFLSGEFVLSTLLFAGAAIYTNILMKTQVPANS